MPTVHVHVTIPTYIHDDVSMPRRRPRRPCSLRSQILLSPATRDVFMNDVPCIRMALFEHWAFSAARLRQKRRGRHVFQCRSKHNFSCLIEELMCVFLVFTAFLPAPRIGRDKKSSHQNHPGAIQFAPGRQTPVSNGSTPGVPVLHQIYINTKHTRRTFAHSPNCELCTAQRENMRITGGGEGSGE